MRSPPVDFEKGIRKAHAMKRIFVGLMLLGTNALLVGLCLRLLKPSLLSAAICLVTPILFSTPWIVILQKER